MGVRVSSHRLFPRPKQPSGSTGPTAHVRCGWAPRTPRPVMPERVACTLAPCGGGQGCHSRETPPREGRWGTSPVTIWGTERALARPHVSRTPCPLLAVAALCTFFLLLGVGGRPPVRQLSGVSLLQRHTTEHGFLPVLGAQRPAVHGLDPRTHRHHGPWMLQPRV